MKELLLAKAAHEDPVEQLLHLLVRDHLGVVFYEPGRDTCRYTPILETGAAGDFMDLVNLRLIQ
jgi:hypothetical protein